MLFQPDAAEGQFPQWCNASIWVVLKEFSIISGRWEFVTLHIAPLDTHIMGSFLHAYMYVTGGAEAYTQPGAGQGTDTGIKPVALWL